MAEAKKVGISKTTPGWDMSQRRAMHSFDTLSTSLRPSNPEMKVRTGWSLFLNVVKGTISKDGIVVRWEFEMKERN